MLYCIAMNATYYDCFALLNTIGGLAGCGLEPGLAKE